MVSRISAKLKRIKKGKASSPSGKAAARLSKKPIVREIANFSSKSRIPQIKWTESYTSLLLGIAVVLIISASLVWFVGRKKVNTTPATGTSQQEMQQPQQKSQQNEAGNQDTYIVKEGDTLWDIAEQVYKAGNQSVNLAKANNITNPDQLVTGTKLTLPKLEKILATNTGPDTGQAQQNMVIGEKITGDTYVVKSGDALWDVALRAYGDGFRWADIAKANGLLNNPNYIIEGVSLKIPRP